MLHARRALAPRSPYVRPYTPLPPRRPRTAFRSPSAPQPKCTILAKAHFISICRCTTLYTIQVGREPKDTCFGTTTVGQRSTPMCRNRLDAPSFGSPPRAQYGTTRAISGQERH
ncbi:hypothetical protein VTO73DRAFT_14641 [Trametes versicolor]